MSKGVSSRSFVKNDLPESLMEKQWYYRIELAPNIFTKGFEFDNYEITRTVLRNTDIAGRNCLDIGTVEGVTPVLLCRRGAKRVVAYDRWNNREKIDAVKSAYGVDYDYVAGNKMIDLKKILVGRGAYPFDVTVFSGVLYHMFDPLAGLALVRGLTRTGGIVVFETAAIIDDTMAVYLNSEGRFYAGTNYFMPSLAALDYMLRFSYLRPLDCLYKVHGTDRKTGLRICRVAIPCRAEAAPVAAAADKWLQGGGFKVDIAEHITLPELQSDLEDVGYRVHNTDCVIRAATNSVDLYNTVASCPPFADDKDLRCLKLTDRE